MECECNKVDDTLTAKIKGRIDSATASDLEKCVEDNLDDSKKLIFDFSDLEYISSAGLRVLLHFQKLMTSKEGEMEIHGANEFVLEVFEITGFQGILTIV